MLDSSNIVQVGVAFAICNHSADFGNHESGWWGCSVARSPGFGLNQTSIQIIKEEISNIFIEPEYCARHCVKCFTYIDS